MTIQNPAPRGHADLATELLDAAAEQMRAPFGKLPDRGQDTALLGIGYALLALREELASQSSDLAGQVHAVADQLGDLAVPADRLADTLEARKRRPRRSWRHREPEPQRCQYCKATDAETELRTNGRTSMCVKTGDCLARERANRETGAVVLPASAAATVRKALADAVAHRSVPLDGEYRPDAQRSGHAEDERLADEYSAVLVQLAGAEG